MPIDCYYASGGTTNAPPCSQISVRLFAQEYNTLFSLSPPSKWQSYIRNRHSAIIVTHLFQIVRTQLHSRTSHKIYVMMLSSKCKQCYVFDNIVVWKKGWSQERSSNSSSRNGHLSLLFILLPTPSPFLNTCILTLH